MQGRAMLERIWTIVIKELLAVWRDRKSRTMLILPPLIQLLIFSFAVTQEVKHVDIGILDHDGGGQARALEDRLTGASPLVASVRMLKGEAEADAALTEQRVIMVAVIPAGFSAALSSGRPAGLDLLFDGRRSNATQILEGYVGTIVQSYGAELAAGRSPAGSGGGFPRSRIAVRALFNPNLDSAWSTVPSLTAILTMLIGIVVTGLSVARERELGTFEQLLVTPARPFEIILGKTVPGMLIGLFEGSLVLLFARLVFKIPFQGSAGLLYLAMAVYLLAVIGVGLFISSLVATQQQAMLGTFVFMVPAMLLSGFTAPIRNMPEWLQPVTLIDPARFFLVIVRGIFLKDMPAADVFANIWPLVLIACVTLSAAAWLFRRRLP